MSSMEIIRDLISEYYESNDFTGSVSEIRIKQIEDMLGVVLPESYKWFIREYGHGGIGGIEIFGVSKAEIPSCVKATQNYRQYDLPQKFVVIENCDEWLHCLDTDKITNGDCPVVDWDRKGNIGIRSFDTFLKFLEERFKDAAENM